VGCSIQYQLGRQKSYNVIFLNNILLVKNDHTSHNEIQGRIWLCSAQAPLQTHVEISEYYKILS
jgi:hypothetical protein